jgi:hypothetical protein
MVMSREWHAAYRARNRERIRLINREGMRQKRAANPDYYRRELEQQADYRERKRIWKTRTVQ